MKITRPHAYKKDIELACAVLQAMAPGTPKTHDVIAAAAGCRKGTISMIQSRALQKIRRRLFLLKDKRFQELTMEALGDQRHRVVGVSKNKKPK